METSLTRVTCILLRKDGSCDKAKHVYTVRDTTYLTAGLFGYREHDESYLRMFQHGTSLS